MFAGARATWGVTKGKVCFECKVWKRKLKIISSVKLKKFISNSSKGEINKELKKEVGFSKNFCPMTCMTGQISSQESFTMLGFELCMLTAGATCDKTSSHTAVLDFVISLILQPIAAGITLNFRNS